MAFLKLIYNVYTDVLFLLKEFDQLDVWSMFVEIDLDQQGAGVRPALYMIIILELLWCKSEK